MHNFKRYSRFLPWFTVLLMSVLTAGCGGGDEGRDPILGSGGIAVLVPTVAVAVGIQRVG